MKKVLALLIAFVMVLSLMACGATSTPSTTTSDAGTPTTQQPSAAPASEAPAASPAAPAVSTEPIRIGHIADLTGVEAMVGKNSVEAFEFAVKAMGGQINGRPVEIIVGDSQSTPSVAVDVAKKMVERDKVVAIFGPTQIGHKSAVSEYIKTAGVPLIFYNGTPAGLLKSNPWLIGADGTTMQMPSVMGDFAYNELKYRKVHTIAMDNTGGRAYVDPFVATFKALGGTVDQQQWAPVPCPDFSPYLVPLGPADALVAWTSSSDAIALWSAWSNLGLKSKLPIVASFHGGMTDYFIGRALKESNPKALEAMLGTYAPVMYCSDIQTPENAAFVKTWTDGHGGEAPEGTNLTGATYQAFMLLKTAIEANKGVTTPDELLKAILAVDFVGPEGHLFFAEGSHAATKDVYIAQVVQTT